MNNVAWNSRFTTESFKEFLYNKYGNKFSYEKVIYSGLNKKVTITCKKHGDISLQAQILVYTNYSCKYCNKEKRIEKQAIKYYNKFIILAKMKWPNIDYSETKPDYVSRHYNFNIICPIHGKFHINGNTFLRSGCPRCNNGLTYEMINRNYSNDEFIQELKNIYGNLYDYSKVKYVNWKTKVNLVCPIHGDFWREPVRLIKDPRGCPYCKKSLLENEIEQYLKQNNINFISEYCPKFNKFGKKRIDFYLPEFNVGIECQGRQHFSENSMYNIGNINDVINYDKNKYEICLENGLKLFYFSHYKIKSYFQTVFTNKDKLLNSIYEYKKLL